MSAAAASESTAWGAFAWLRARLLFAPTLAWNFLLARVLKVRSWWSEIAPELWVGALPLPADVNRLAQLGITAVVNTCEEYSGPQAAYRRSGIRQFRMPTIDFTHPRLRDVQAAVAFIRDEIAAGGKVYVHCKAGRGRSATVAACWLMADRGLNRHQAQELLRQRRPHVNSRLAERPVVIEFERQLQYHSNSEGTAPPKASP